MKLGGEGFTVEKGSFINTTLAAAIGPLLVVVYELNHPFRGDACIAPEGFGLVLEQLPTWER